MKKIVHIICAILIFTQLPSCKKDLDLLPVDQLPEVYVWNDPSLIQTFVNNIYGGIPHGFSHIMMASIVDETTYNADAGTQHATKSLITQSDLGLFDAKWWASIGTRLRGWDYIYKYVRTCNVFFEKVDAAPFDDENMRKRLKGEVHFLRAYLYHNALGSFGGVPVITKAFTLNDSFNVARSSYEETVKFITSECDSAASLLPETTSEEGRATKGAALALKSRTLLWAASDFANSNGSWAGVYDHKELIGYVGGDRTSRWQAAKDAAKAVMDLGKYALSGSQSPASKEEATQNYANIFLQNKTSEDIYAKFFTTKFDEGWDGYNPGLYQNPNGWHGWGSNCPVGQMADAYEMEDGTPFSWSNPAAAATPYEKRDPRFYASINYNGAAWRPRPSDVVNADKSFQDNFSIPVNTVKTAFWEKWNPTNNTIDIIGGLDTRKSPYEDWNGTYTGYFMRKFVDPTVDAQYNKQTQPWRYFRYTEILLNYAEACLGLQQESEAKTYLNMIRKRAGMPDITETGTALVQRYRNERRVEMAFEDQRYYDVRRWMIAPSAYTNAESINILYKLNPDHTTSTTPTYSVGKALDRAWNERFYLLPIKLDELNKNKLLIQNPLY